MIDMTNELVSAFLTAEDNEYETILDVEEYVEMCKEHESFIRHLEEIK